MIRNSGLFRLFAAFARVWRESFLCRALFNESGAEASFARGYVSRGLNAVARFAERTSGRFRESLTFCLFAAAGGFFKRKFGAVWMASYTGRGLARVFSFGAAALFALALLFVVPILPTKFTLAGGVCAVCLFLFSVFCTGKVKLTFRAMDAAALCFALVLAVGTARSYNPAASFPMAAVYVLFILLYFVYRNALDSMAKIKAAAAVLLTSGLLVSLYGVYQKMTGRFIATEAWIDSDMFGEAANRVYSTLDNPNVLGEYLLLIIPIAFAALYFVKPLRAKILPLGVLGAAVLCMVYTQSRGAWLGLLFGFALFALLHDKRLVALGIVGLALTPMFLPQSIIERFMSIGDMGDSSTSYRVNIWLASVLMIRRFWPSGIGPGTDTFVYIYRLFAFNAVNAPHSHNLFLQITIDTGVAGIGTFAVLMAGYFKNMLLAARQAANSAFGRGMAAALLAGMAGYLLQGLTDNVWYNYRVVALFWIVLAIGAALKDQAGKAVLE